MTQWLGQVVMLTTASGIVPALTTAHYVDGAQTDIGASTADSVDLVTLGSSSTQFTNVPRIAAPTFSNRLTVSPGYYFVGEAGEEGSGGGLPTTPPFIFLEDGTNRFTYITVDGTDTSSTEYVTQSVGNDGTTRVASIGLWSNTDSQYNQAGQIQIYTSSGVAEDSNQGSAGVQVASSGQAGLAGIFADAVSGTNLTVEANPDQVLPIISTLDHDGNNIFVVTPFDNLTYGPEKSAFTFTAADPATAGAGGDLFIGKSGNTNGWGVNIFGYEHWSADGTSDKGGAVSLSTGTGGAQVYAQSAPPSTYLYINSNSDGQPGSDIFGVSNGQNNHYILQISGPEKMGFFNATPVDKPTGIGVSAAAIHAALVSLGLIGA